MGSNEGLGTLDSLRTKNYHLVAPVTRLIDKLLTAHDIVDKHMTFLLK